MSNRLTFLFILIGSGKLYLALNDAVERTCIDPNKLPKVTSEHNLEKSVMPNCSIYDNSFGMITLKNIQE